MGIAEGIDIRKMVEEPYSGPGHAIYASYSTVVMLVGGSAITFAFSIIQDLRLVQKDLRRMTTRYMSSRDVCWTRAGQRGSQLPKSKRRCLSSTIL